MTDRLPDGAVEAITLYRCPVHGWMEQATVNLGIDSGQGCPVIEGESACWEKMEGPKRFAALPPGTVIVVGEDGQVTSRTQSMSNLPDEIKQWFTDKHEEPFYGDLVRSNRIEGWNSGLYAAESFIRRQFASGRLAALSATDTGEADG